jgi:uncharacterized membrane protein
MVGGIRPTLLGLASGGALAFAVIGFRGAILSLGLADYVMAATFTLVVGLAIQSAALSLYLSLRRPTVMFALLRAWKPSLFAGFMGALASQFWFLAFALATAASVRTLALVEVLFAQLVARYGFGQRTSAREAIGMALVVAGLPSVLVVRQDRQGMKFDALFVQLFCFIRRCFAVDRAMLGLAIMDLARLFGEAWPDIARVFGNVIAKFFELVPQLALGAGHHRDRRFRRNWRHRSGLQWRRRGGIGRRRCRRRRPRFGGFAI